MTYAKSILAATLPSVVVAAVAFGELAHAAPKPKALTAVNAAQAPALDGTANDPAWQKAKAVELEFVKGENFGGTEKTTGTIKAARVGDMLYLLLQYQDATYSQRRFPFVKQPDGSWLKLKSPENKGGDENKFYEDKAALLWPIKDSIAGFDEDGCFMSCHDKQPPKPYGNKYTEKEGELGDLWHFKSVRTGPVGQVDDGYVDHVRYEPQKAETAGRHGDPKSGGGYKNIELKDGKPEFMNKDGKAANKGGTYWLKVEDKSPFDDSKFQPGDEVASIMVSKIEGDAGDIGAGILWKDGVWTIEIARKLVTGSKFDVQFDDLSKGYLFGVSVFDNAQVRHAYVKRPLMLVFEK
ncbi:MAG: ethylbenzene dehydrogenase-related protein [Pseudomonadota bacterium]